MLSGAYDPITPPQYGQMVALMLKHSYYMMFPGVGHGASVGDICPYRVALDFVDNPTVKPETGCVSVMTEPQFVIR